MKSWGISIASEGEQRRLMKAQLSEMTIDAESIPFSFKCKSSGQELRPAPLAFVTNLKAMLFYLLDEKDRLVHPYYTL